MKTFELHYNHVLPSGNVYVLHDPKKNFFIETTQMQDIDTKRKPQEILTTTDPKVIKEHLVPIKDKWLIAISTQYGCPHKCMFCQVPGLGFHGNLSADQMWEQIEFVLSQRPEVTECHKIKLGFSRMGEPFWNWQNICQVMKEMKTYRDTFTFLPCYNTIMPKGKSLGKRVEDVILDEVMPLKEYLSGNMHLQISCNSTDEEQRKKLFGGADVLSIQEIGNLFNGIKNTGRLVTLNFICGDGWEIDPKKLENLDSNIFCIKLTPLNINPAASGNGLKDAIGWNWDKMYEIRDRLEGFGLKVIIDICAMAELDLSCGTLIQTKILCNYDE